VLVGNFKDEMWDMAPIRSKEKTAARFTNSVTEGLLVSVHAADEKDESETQQHRGEHGTEDSGFDDVELVF
jgi:hypothetical protein